MGANPLSSGAGEGNRTLVISLEGFCSAIELHPPSIQYSLASFPPRRSAAPLRIRWWRGWIRTNVGARPTDLQSAPFSRSGTLRRNLKLSENSGAWSSTAQRNFTFRSASATSTPSRRQARCSRRATQSLDCPGDGTFSSTTVKRPRCGRDTDRMGIETQGRIRNDHEPGAIETDRPRGRARPQYSRSGEMRNALRAPALRTAASGRPDRSSFTPSDLDIRDPPSRRPGFRHLIVTSSAPAMHAVFRASRPPIPP